LAVNPGPAQVRDAFKALAAQCSHADDEVSRQRFEALCWAYEVMGVQLLTYHQMDLGIKCSLVADFPSMQVLMSDDSTAAAASAAAAAGAGSYHQHQHYPAAADSMEPPYGDEQEQQQWEGEEQEEEEEEEDEQAAWEAEQEPFYFDADAEVDAHLRLRAQRRREARGAYMMDVWDKRLCV
jgi:hypothetical protein